MLLPATRATIPTFRAVAPRMVDEPMVFEAQGDPATAVALALVVAIPFGYWWLITVPEARLDLSKDKRKGGMRGYIDELRADQTPRAAERWFFKKYLDQLPDRPLDPPPPTANADAPAADADAPSPSLGELFQPASLKGNATPNFWSGDNPIVVTMAALLACGVFATGVRTNAALTVDAVVLAAGVAFGVSRLSLD